MAKAATTSRKPAAAKAPAVATTAVTETGSTAAASAGETVTTETAQAPAAAPAVAAEAPEAPVWEGPVLVVTGPRAGFRRGGFKFEAEPLALTPFDFGFVPGSEADLDIGERLLAILEEPTLHCSLRFPDGTEHRFLPEAVEAARAALELRKSGGSDEDVRHLLDDLFDGRGTEPDA